MATGPWKVYHRSRMVQRAEPEPLAKLVKRALNGANLGSGLEVMRLWPQVAGSLIAAHLKPVRFCADVLFVSADQAVWGHQLIFLRAELLARYEKCLGCPVVQDIRLTTQLPLPVSQTSALCSERNNYSVKLPELSSAEENSIADRAARQIRDPKLAQRWAKLQIIMKREQAARRLDGERSCESCGVPHRRVYSLHCDHCTRLARAKDS